jgi:hypothetical protein
VHCTDIGTKNVPPYRLVADGDTLHVTYEEAADPDPAYIYTCEVSIRDLGAQKDVVYLAKPQPAWETSSDGQPLEYVLQLNARTTAQRNINPVYAHSREALEEKLATLVAEPGAQGPTV